MQPKFHVYIDFTTDGRPFYVGMGDNARIQRRLGRNKRHTHTAQKHGLVRNVIQSFEQRQDAIDLEIKLIAEKHTFVDDPAYSGYGCNYTSGGEGCACSEETRRKISESKRGREPWNKGKHVTYRKTEKSLAQRRNSIIAFNKTKPMLGKQHTEEALQRMRKPHICSICKTSGHTKTTCPERPIDAINVVALAQQRRHQKFPG